MRNVGGYLKLGCSTFFLILSFVTRIPGMQ
jgi:hypothetical protein